MITLEFYIKSVRILRTVIEPYDSYICNLFKINDNKFINIDIYFNSDEYKDLCLLLTDGIIRDKTDWSIVDPEIIINKIFNFHKLVINII